MLMIGKGMLNMLYNHVILYGHIAQIKQYRDTGTCAHTLVTQNAVYGQIACFLIVQGKICSGFFLWIFPFLPLFVVLKYAPFLYVALILHHVHFSLSRFIVVLCNFDLVVGVGINCGSIAVVFCGFVVYQHIQPHVLNIF